MKKLITTLFVATAVLTTSHAQTALNFDGNDDIAVVGNSMTNDLVGSTTFTVEAWVNSSTTTGNGVIVGNYNFPANNSNMQFLLRRDGSGYRFNLNDGNGYQGIGTGAGAVNTGQWQHIAGTWDGTSIRIYLDGVEVGVNGSLTGPGMPAMTNEVVFGNNAMPESFTGSIDNVRIWSTTRSRSEIVESMNQCLTGAETDLLAMYTFEDGTGSTVLTDETGNGYNGTLTNMDPNTDWIGSIGGPQVALDQSVTAAASTICPNTSTTIDLPNTQDGVLYYLRNDNGDSIISGPEMGTGGVSFSTGNLSSTTTFNVFGSYRDDITALSFDGNDDIVSMGNNLSNDMVGLNTITVEAWVKPAKDTPGNYNVFGNYSYPGNNNSMQLLIRQEGSSYAFFLDDGNGYQSVSTGAGFVTVGQWQHVVGVWDGNATRIYVDGVEVAANNSLTGPGLPTTANEYYIGNNDLNESFEGDVDKVRVWNYVRSNAEINATDSVCLEGSENGLLALYGMENGPGNTVLSDQTGNGYDGTLLNMDPDIDWVRGVDCSTCGSQMTTTETVTVEDVTDPVLAGLPTDINTTVNAANCEATVTWTAPTASDNCTSSPAITSSHNSGDNFSLGTTTVTYTATDDEGNNTTGTFDVTVTSDLASSAAVTSSYNGAEVSCNGANDGEATTTPVDGTAPYTYLWSDGQTTATATGLAAGTYTVDVTDDNGCIVTSNVTVNEPDVLAGTATATDATCNGDTDGEVTLNVSGGTTSYSFAWDDASNSTTQDLTGVGAGAYEVNITDANGCTATASATVGEPDVLAGTATATDATCNGDTDGEVTLNVSGGSTAYSFAWDDASNSTTQNLTGVGAGTYEVDITDANGCTATASATVGEPTALSATATTTDETMGADGTIDLTPDGGTTPYTYSWTGPNGFTSTDQNPTGLEGGTYEVTITDDNGCVFTLEVIVESVVGIEEFAHVNFNVYPNPSNGVFTVNTSQKGAIVIMDNKGKNVYSTTVSNGKTPLQLSQLAHGVYTIQLTTNAGFQVKKLIIQ
ncbi:MAG: LamG-like jellyroll fold domain-containing protein [Bacteroidota bacterium]